MGAYYQGTIVTEDYVGRIDSFKYDVGKKLMEHGYLRNDYVNTIINCLPKDTPILLMWLCDYCENENYNWDTIPKDSLSLDIDDTVNPSLYFKCPELKESISIQTLVENEKDWMIHPLVLLCNSETESVGGGDYHQDCNFRNNWFGLKIIVTKEKPDESYKDITLDVIRYEN